MSTDSAASTSAGTEAGSGLSLVDCDVHPYHVPDEIVEYLPEHYAEQQGFNLPSGQWSNPHEGFRGDARPVDGTIAGSDPELLYRQVVEEEGTDYPILNAGGILGLAVSPQSDYAAAVATAYNDWFVEKWLDYADEFVGSIAVAPQRPRKAVEEIEKHGDHPGVVQVVMSSATEFPYGRPKYWPIYEAAAERDLPVAVHPGSEGRGTAFAPSGAGIPSTFFEFHVTMACNYVSNLVSLVAEGTFAEYPDLDFVFLEGGFTWIPAALWRLDRNWRRYREEVPYLEKPPSEYVREHCWFGTQPVPEPEDWDHLRQTVDMMPAEDLLLYCSDYPHWDNDSPDHALPPLDDDVERAMYWENAAELYDLPRDAGPE